MNKLDLIYVPDRHHNYLNKHVLLKAFYICTTLFLFYYVFLVCQRC